MNKKNLYIFLIYLMWCSVVFAHEAWSTQAVKDDESRMLCLCANDTTLYPSCLGLGYPSGDKCKNGDTTYMSCSSLCSIAFGLSISKCVPVQLPYIVSTPCEEAVMPGREKVNQRNLKGGRDNKKAK